MILIALLTIGALGVVYMRAGSGGSDGLRLYANLHFLDEPALMISLENDRAFTLAEVLQLEPTGLPEVHFEVRDGAFAFVKSDCPDLLCVSMGPQSQRGGFAACLPNRLFFYIEEAQYTMYSTVFFDIFDTVVFLRIFAASQHEFERIAGGIHGELLALHRLFDIFGEHDGISNIATIKRMAGMSLDVGGLAKGFALEVAASAARELGVTSGIISLRTRLALILET